MSKLETNTVDSISGTSTLTLGGSNASVVSAGTEVRSNKLSPASGTALQIGDSGDTITIPSGATIVNSGTATNFGESNTPMFFVSGPNQTISHNTNTKMTIDSESFDTDNCFDLAGTKRFVPNKAGKYFFTLSLFSPDTDDIDYWTSNVKKNGGSGGGFSGVQRNYNNVCYNGILTANGSSDYFEAFCEQESGSNRTIAVSEFSAFYIGN